MTDLIISIVDFITNFGVKIMPDMSDFTRTFSDASTHVGALVDFFQHINFIVPLPTIVTIVGIEISIHVATFLFWVGHKIAKTVVSLIP